MNGKRILIAAALTVVVGVVVVVLVRRAGRASSSSTAADRADNRNTDATWSTNLGIDGTNAGSWA